MSKRITVKKLKEAGAIRALVTFHDLIMACLAVVLAYLLRLDANFELMANHFPAMLWVVLISGVVGFLAYRMNGLHRGVWRYASIPDFMGIFRSAIWVAGVLAVLGLAVRDIIVIPRSIPFLVLLLLPALLGGSRLFYRIVKDGFLVQGNFAPSGEQNPVILVGNGNAVSAFIRSCIASSNNPYWVVGILTPVKSHLGGQVLGVPILGSFSDLKVATSHLATLNIEPRRLVFTKEVLNNRYGDKVGNLIDDAKKLGLPVSRLPSIDALTDVGANETIALKSVALEDVLGRASRQFDTTKLKHQFVGSVVMVTGGGGSIGSELARQLSLLPLSKLIILDQNEFNLYSIEQELLGMGFTCELDLQLASIRNRERIFQVIRDNRPDTIFHAAALKHVPLMEKNPLEAVLTNVYGTLNVVEGAGEYGVSSFVLVSTDKAVNPSSIMGTTKRLAEYVTLKAGERFKNTRFQAVRFGNVLGSSGSVVPTFKKQIEEGGPITVTHKDMTRYFMTTSEAVSLILQAYSVGHEIEGDPTKIYVLDMGEPVKIDTLARQLIRLSGRIPDKDIKIVYSGVRPGEKLYEELFYDEEALGQTGVSGLFSSCGLQTIELDLEPLLKKSLANDKDGAREWVEEFRQQVQQQSTVSRSTDLQATASSRASA